MERLPEMGWREVLSVSMSRRIQGEAVIDGEVPSSQVSSVDGEVQSAVLSQEGLGQENRMTDIVKWKHRDELIEDLTRMAKIPDENISNIKKLNTRNLNRLCETISKARGHEWKPYQIAEK